jgi:hypothetical protein
MLKDKIKKKTRWSNKKKELTDQKERKNFFLNKRFSFHLSFTFSLFTFNFSPLTFNALWTIKSNFALLNLKPNQCQNVFFNHKTPNKIAPNKLSSLIINQCNIK